jgi:hypothetical protein
MPNVRTTSDSRLNMQRRLDGLAFALAGLLPACTLAAPVPDAVVQPDSATLKVPLDAFTLVRGGVTVPSQAALEGCDVVRFNAAQTGVRQVRITTTRGGKNIALAAGSAPYEVACAGAPGAHSLSDAAVRVWLAISGGERASVPAPGESAGAARSEAAATRGAAAEAGTAEFALPVFAAKRSTVVAGRRALLVAWQGPPGAVAVTLVRASDGATLAEAQDVSGNEVRLPVADLRPGHYSVVVRHTSMMALRADSIDVVPRRQMPAMPPALARSRLPEADRGLLYAWYLEGLGDGQWTFEALQQAAAMKSTPALRDWMNRFSSAG